MSSFEVLVSCVRRDPPERIEEQLRAALRAGEDLHRAAVNHGLASMLYVRLQEDKVHTVLPESQWQRIRQAHLVTVARQTRTFVAATNILRNLRAARVKQVLPIKGLALAAAWWPEYMARDMVDIDLLVGPDEFAPALSTLEKLGFGPIRPDWGPNAWGAHHPPLEQNGLRIDLHWTPWPLGYKLFPASLSMADIWQRATQGRLDNEVITIPCPEDCLIVQAAGLVYDSFDVRLRHWADIYWLATHPRPGLDMQYLKEMACNLRVQGLVYLVLRFTDEVFGLEELAAQWATPAWEEVYAQVRPILWRRLITPIRSSWIPKIFDLAFSGSFSGGAWRNSAAAWQCGRSPKGKGTLYSLIQNAGGPLVAVMKSARYVGRLVFNADQRQVLRDELSLIRGLRRMAEAVTTCED